MVRIGMIGALSDTHFCILSRDCFNLSREYFSLWAIKTSPDLTRPQSSSYSAQGERRERWVPTKGAQGEMGREKAKEEDDWEIFNLVPRFPRLTEGDLGTRLGNLVSKSCSTSRKVVRCCFSHFFCHRLICCV